MATAGYMQVVNKPNFVKDDFMEKIKEIQDQMNKLPTPAHERHCPYCEPRRCPHCGQSFTYPQPGVWM